MFVHWDIDVCVQQNNLKVAHTTWHVKYVPNKTRATRSDEHHKTR